MRTCFATFCHKGWSKVNSLSPSFRWRIGFQLYECRDMIFLLLHVFEYFLGIGKSGILFREVPHLTSDRTSCRFSQICVHHHVLLGTSLSTFFIGTSSVTTISISRSRKYDKWQIDCHRRYHLSTRSLKWFILRSHHPIRQILVRNSPCLHSCEFMNSWRLLPGFRVCAEKSQLLTVRRKMIPMRLRWQGPIERQVQDPHTIYWPHFYR